MMKAWSFILNKYAKNRSKMQKKALFFAKNLDIRKKVCNFAGSCYLVTIQQNNYIIN